MVTIILIVAYLVFISLGLPDAIFGVGWPLMQVDLNVPIDRAGLFSVISTTGTMISSFYSGKVLSKFGIGKVIFVSVLLTSFGLLGISIVPSFYFLIPLAIPLGLGAGSIDTAINNYVATHYKPHHMPWLHSFWGVGAMVGPLIMAQTLSNQSWRGGFQFIGLVQFVIAILMFLFIPFWKTSDKVISDDEKDHIVHESFFKTLKINGVIFAMIVFLTYVAIEFSVGLWGSSYLVETHELSLEKAANFIAFYYGGITLGRFLSGFITFKLTNRQQILGGISIITFAGIILLVTKIPMFLFAALLLMGLGLAPIFPAMVSETPKMFGKTISKHIIGYELASANLGALLLPALFGVLARFISVSTFPIYLIILIGLLGLSVIKLYRLT